MLDAVTEGYVPRVVEGGDRGLRVVGFNNQHQKQLRNDNGRPDFHLEKSQA